MLKEVQLVEIYANSKGAVYQCDTTNQFVVNFLGTTTYFSVRQFLDFRRVISQININIMLERIERAFDLELIYLPQKDELYTLEICEIYHLKELLTGAKAMLDLHSLLKELNINLVLEDE
ncbi:MAG: hypothetical protein OHK0045_09950 [Raineya sp.]